MAVPTAHASLVCRVHMMYVLMVQPMLANLMSDHCICRR